MISIILASGQGTRMRPLSYYIPKVLLPVRGVPVLEYLLENMARLNIDTHYVVVSEHLETVDKYIDRTGLKNVRLIRGLEWETGGDLALALEQIDPNGDVLVLNGDLVTDLDMSLVYADHMKSDAYVTLAAVEADPSQKRFGRLAIDGDRRVTEFKEKAEVEGSDLLSVGLYVFDRKLISDRRGYLPFRRFKTELELFPRLVKESKLFASVQRPTYYWDVGTPESYREAGDNLGKEVP